MGGPTAAPPAPKKKSGWGGIGGTSLGEPSVSIFWTLVMLVVSVAITSGVCWLCSKKQYKAGASAFEKIDVGSVGTGPSIYDSTWAR